MKIAIAGSTGLLGEALYEHLLREGHLVKRLVRLNKLEEGILWDPVKKKIKLDELEGFDAIVNLCGENISNARWNKAKKRRIRESRLQATSFLYHAGNYLCSIFLNKTFFSSYSII